MGTSAGPGEKGPRVPGTLKPQITHSCSETLLMFFSWKLCNNPNKECTISRPKPTAAEPAQNMLHGALGKTCQLAGCAISPLLFRVLLMQAVCRVSWPISAAYDSKSGYCLRRKSRLTFLLHPNRWHCDCKKPK